MTVNTPRSSFSRAPLAPASGQRLYLREDELDAGVTMILDASYALKAQTLAARVKHDLNWTQARALAELMRIPQGVSALAVQLNITKQASIKTIEELELRRLVTREDDPRDGRRRTIHLTADGEIMARDINVAMRTLLAQAYRQAGGDAVTGCDAVLTAIRLG